MDEWQLFVFLAAGLMAVLAVTWLRAFLRQMGPD